MSRTETTAEDVIAAMAYRREDFKNKVGEKVGGALFEYYKATLASSSGQTRWVQHWRSEVERLIETELVIVLLHRSKDSRTARRLLVNKSKKFVPSMRSIDKPLSEPSSAITA